MPAKNINAEKKYISRKVKAVRWKPSKSLTENAHIFVTGSWDDEENNLSVWQVSKIDGDSTLVEEIPQSHNVNDIQYITRELLAVATGSGSIQLFRHNQSDGLDCCQVWDRFHKLKSVSASCTALASNGEQVASVGEDGKIFIYNPEEKQAIKTIDSESECSEYAVVFVKAAEIVTGNMQGHLKLWDLRAANSLKATLLSPDQVSVCDLCSHPTQQHLVAAGGEDGALSLWDMRATSQPLVVISAHSGPINEVQFHPSAPDHLFTCGADGRVLHWDSSLTSQSQIIGGTKESSGIRSEGAGSKGGLTNSWFSDDVKQGLVDAISLIPASRLPINSINIDSETLLAGSDNEAVYIIKNVLVE